MVLDTSDAKRTAAALRLLAGADTWQRGRDRDGAAVWFIPSERTPGLFHIVSAKGCTCPDARHRAVTCKHQRAGALHAARLRAESTGHRKARAASGQRAASDTYAAIMADHFGEEG